MVSSLHHWSLIQKREIIFSSELLGLLVPALYSGVAVARGVPPSLRRQGGRRCGSEPGRKPEALRRVPRPLRRDVRNLARCLLGYRRELRDLPDPGNLRHRSIRQGGAKDHRRAGLDEPGVSQEHRGSALARDLQSRACPSHSDPVPGCRTARSAPGRR